MAEFYWPLTPTSQELKSLMPSQRYAKRRYHMLDVRVVFESLRQPTQRKGDVIPGFSFIIVPHKSKMTFDILMSLAYLAEKA